MENTNKQVAKTNNSGERVTETQMEMVGRLVLKIAQVKLPMDLLHIEDRIDEVLRFEKRDDYVESEKRYKDFVVHERTPKEEKEFAKNVKQMAEDNMPDHEWCDGCGKLVHKSYMTDSVCQDCINEDTEEDEEEAN